MSTKLPIVELVPVKAFSIRINGKDVTGDMREVSRWECFIKLADSKGNVLILAPEGFNANSLSAAFKEVWRNWNWMDAARYPNTVIVSGSPDLLAQIQQAHEQAGAA